MAHTLSRGWTMWASTDNPIALSGWPSQDSLNAIRSFANPPTHFTLSLQGLFKSVPFLQESLLCPPVGRGIEKTPKVPAQRLTNLLLCLGSIHELPLHRVVST